MTAEASEQERVTPWRTRWARIVLMVGLAVAVAPLLAHFPHEQVLVFRPHESIARLEASWTAEGEGTATGGVTLNLPQPQREVIQRVSLPNGRYTLAIHVDRPQSDLRAPNRGSPASQDGAQPVDTTVIRTVTLSGGETIIGL